MDDLDRVAAWLAERLPEDRATPAWSTATTSWTTCCSGPEPPVRLLAVVDWELATRGDPLADLGWFLAFWREAATRPSSCRSSPRLTELPGFSTRAELVARYAERVGRLRT
jgi:aminoglycoside phosphotransferase (APT) family kinase protein